ncbi:MAG: hypothetical protein ACK5OB_00380 [Pirellula sp.]
MPTANALHSFRYRPHCLSASMLNAIKASILLALGVCSFGMTLTEACAQDTSDLQVGFASVDITPTIPTPMAGYYGVRYSTGTHDPLWAKATWLSDGQTSAALITIDLIATTPWMVRETRRIVEEKLGLPPHAVMISASHSHTGPMLFESESAMVGRFGNQTDEAKRYMLELPAKIAASVAEAKTAARSVSIQHGVGTETKLAFNRRFFMRDGTVGWNPGKLNPNIVREAGPTDDSLPIVCFTEDSRKIVGVLSNFAIHLDTVGGTLWSADMPFTMEESLQRVFGSECHIQYATGCCGDVNHIDVRSSLPQGGNGEAARIGTRLAAAVLRQMPMLQPVSGMRVHASHTKLRLPVAPHTAERSQWARGVLERIEAKQTPPFMEMVEAYRIADVEARADGTIDAEVQVISLSPEIAWVALPGEIFVQLGIAIHDASPFSTTSIHELANGSIGYVPTRQAYSQGNYEVVSARCAEGSGEQMVDEAIRQLRAHYEMQRASASKKP